jgi:AcrR family transcriptional regulator
VSKLLAFFGGIYYINSVNFINIINFEGELMKTIQEERMRGYFLSAAKELIRGEGLEVVSTRNVAARAGYSYATLYNYFKDIRDLIFSSVEDFMSECREFVAKEVPGTVSGEKALIAISIGYTKFFVQYPGIFDLFYQEKANRIGTTKSNLRAIDTLFDSLVEHEWNVLKNQKKSTDQAIARTQEFHKLALHGLVMFYLNSRIDVSYRDLMKQVDEITRFAIKTL